MDPGEVENGTQSRGKYNQIPLNLDMSESYSKRYRAEKFEEQVRPRFASPKQNVQPVQNAMSGFSSLSAALARASLPRPVAQILFKVLKFANLVRYHPITLAIIAQLRNPSILAIRITLIILVITTLCNIALLVKLALALDDKRISLAGWPSLYQFIFDSATVKEPDYEELATRWRERVFQDEINSHNRFIFPINNTNRNVQDEVNRLKNAEQKRLALDSKYSSFWRDHREDILAGPFCMPFKHISWPVTRPGDPVYTYRYTYSLGADNWLYLPCHAHYTGIERTQTTKEPSQFCMCGKETVLVGIINSANSITSYQRRSLIRKTWLKEFRENARFKHLYKFFFVVGERAPLSPEEAARLSSEQIEDRKQEEIFLRTMLAEESALHGDILQVRIQDSYRNISAKLVAAFDFMLQSCPHAVFHYKGDDDVLVVPWNLHNWTKKRLAKPVSDGGFMYGRSKWEYPEKNASIKHYIPDYIVPDRPWGYQYLAGGGILMPASVTRMLFVASLCVNMLFADDVQYTGLLRHELGVRFEWAEDITNKKIVPLTAEKYDHMLVVMQMEDLDMIEIWLLMKRNFSTTAKFQRP